MALNRRGGEICRTISENLTELKASGVTQSTIAGELGVSEATVSRWANAKSAPTSEQIVVLSSRWPGFFDRGELSELFAIATFGETATADLMGSTVTLLSSTEAVFERLTESINREPRSSNARVLRQMALHMDRRSDPGAESVPSPELQRVWGDFASAMDRRATEGWKVVQVYAMATTDRVDVLQKRIQSMVGPDIRTSAYSVSLPRVLNLFVVGDRDVFVALDHQRWERPSSGVLIQNEEVARWASDYVDELFWAAPYKLREPHRLHTEVFDQIRSDIASRSDVTGR